MVKIAALSTICADIFDGTDQVRIGGEAYNFAMAASEYAHVEMSIIAGVGNDIYGRTAIECLREKNVDTSCVHVIEGGRTASNRIYLTEAGERYFKSNSWDGGVYQEFELSGLDKGKMRNADIVFINYYSPNFPDVLKLKEEYGYQLAVDFDVVRDFNAIEKTLYSIDYVFISGEESILSIFAKWSEKYRAIFNMTLGHRGSVTYFGGEEYRVNAVPVQKVIDTTGCGDGYHAGFLASYASDHDIILAMREGSKIASKILSGIGGNRERRFLYGGITEVK